MDLRQLHYFKTIVEEGTISSAARKLHVSQPPLSSQIHNIQQQHPAESIVSHHSHKVVDGGYQGTRSNCGVNFYLLEKQGYYCTHRARYQHSYHK